LAEKKRIDQFKDVITEQLFPGAVQKEIMFKNTISDINGY
jgi:hypothetical protein